MRAPKLALLLAAAALVMGVAAASVTYVTPTLVESSSRASNVDETTTAHTEEKHEEEQQNAHANKDDGTGHTPDAHKRLERARIMLRVHEARAQGRDHPVLEDSSVSTPYTYDNMQPAYRSTYMRYPWMHEPFGRKPDTPHPRFPIGAHVEFPWQKEAREEYADMKLRKHEELEAQLRSNGGPAQHMPNPLPFNPRGEAWMTSHPFGPPPGSYPYYPMPHPELMQSFDSDGNAQHSTAVHPAVADAAALHAISHGGVVGAHMMHPDVAAHALSAASAFHPDAHAFGYFGASLGAAPYMFSGVGNPYYAPHPMTHAAAAAGAGFYGGAGYIGAGARDII